MNGIAEKFYGKSNWELVGHHMSDIFPQQWTEGQLRAIEKHVNTREHFEISYHSPSSNQWVLLTGWPFENYYTFSCKVIDQKSALNSELRKEVRKGKKN